MYSLLRSPFDSDYHDLKRKKVELENLNQELKETSRKLFARAVKAELSSLELAEALRELATDVRSKPNDTRYATCLKKAKDALTKFELENL